MSGALMLRKARHKGVDVWLPDEYADLDMRPIELLLEQVATAAVGFDITNVVEYLDSLGADKRDDISIADLPCVVPPLPFMWVEFPRPKGGDWWMWGKWGDVRRAAVFVRSADFADPDSDAAGNFAQHIPAATMESARFGVDASLFLDMTRPNRPDIPTTITGPAAQVLTVLDEFGGWSCHPNNRSNFQINWLSPVFHEWFKHGREDRPEKVSRMAAAVMAREFLLQVWFAISLTHCANVRMIENDGRYHNRQERRLAERRGDPPPTKYYTLEIGGITKTLDTEGGAKTNGLKKALHICRGHFAHYSEERPLFGKYAGQFWIPAHVRGSADAGKVIKDYEVKAPAA